MTGLGRQLKQVALLGVYGKGPEIGSLSSARQLARKLFDNLEKGGGGEKAGADERVLVVDDFLPVRLALLCLLTVSRSRADPPHLLFLSAPAAVLPQRGGRGKGVQAL